MDRDDYRVVGDLLVVHHLLRHVLELDVDQAFRFLLHLARPDIDRDVRKIIAVHGELERTVGGRLDDTSAGGTEGLVPAHVEVLDRADRLEDLHLLGGDVARGEGSGLAHRQIGDDLHDVVLDRIPDHPDLLVEPEALVDPVRLIEDDLDRLDRPVVPDPSDDVVVEAHQQDVLHELLAEVVVDPKDLLVGERLFEDPVVALRALKIEAERFLDDDPLGALAVTGKGVVHFLDLMDRILVEGRLKRQIIDEMDVPAALDLLGEAGDQIGNRLLLGGVVEEIIQMVGEALRSLLIYCLFEKFFAVLIPSPESENFKLISMPHQVPIGGIELLHRQIAGSAELNDDRAHGYSLRSVMIVESNDSVMKKETGSVSGSSPERTRLRTSRFPSPRKRRNTFEVARIRKPR